MNIRIQSLDNYFDRQIGKYIDHAHKDIPTHLLVRQRLLKEKRNKHRVEITLKRYDTYVRCMFDYLLAFLCQVDIDIDIDSMVLERISVSNWPLNMDSILKEQLISGLFHFRYFNKPD